VRSVGLDTGFFLKLFEDNKEAVRVWERIVEGDLMSKTSTLVLFELKRIFLKLGRSSEWEKVKRAITLNCEVVPVDENLAELGASISYGTGLPTVDALIYATVKDTEAFYTADSHFEVVAGHKRPKIIFLKDEA